MTSDLADGVHGGRAVWRRGGADGTLAPSRIELDLGRPQVVRGGRVPSLGEAQVAMVGLALGAGLVAAMSTGSTSLTLAASLIAMAVSVLSPVIGLTSMAFLVALVRPAVIPAPGFYIAMAAAIVFGAVLRLPIERPKLRRPSPELLLLGAFVLYAMAHFISGMLGGYPGFSGRDTQSLAARLVEGIAVFAVTYVALRGRSPYPALVAMLAASACASVVALSQLMGTDGVFANLMPPPDPSGRISGLFGNPNYFGAYMALMTALAVALAAETSAKRYKLLLLALVTLLVPTLLFTQSRGALVALAAGLVAVAMVRGPLRGLLVAGGLALLALVAYPALAAWRFGDRGDNLASAAGRTDAWSAGLESFASSPLFGIGLGRSAEESSAGMASHSWYVQVLAELGLIGIVLWLCFVAAVFLVLRHRPRPARSVGYAVLATLSTAAFTMSPPETLQLTGPALIAIGAACSGLWSHASDVGDRLPILRTAPPGVNTTARRRQEWT